MSREIEKLRDCFLEGKIDPLIWERYFPIIQDHEVPSCNECKAFSSYECLGNDSDVISCMIKKTSMVKRFKKRPWRGGN